MRPRYATRGEFYFMAILMLAAGIGIGVLIGWHS